jgi:integrase
MRGIRVAVTSWAMVANVAAALAQSPVHEYRAWSKPRPRPVAPADADIAAVAHVLRRQEILHRQDGRTRARFLVLATSGRRPAELKRAERTDVDLSRRLWFTRAAKGGYHTIVFLNDDQLAA